MDHPEIFGGGDCIYFQDQPMDKVGVYAVRENPVLLHNLMASLDGDALEAFDPGRDYLLIFNLGDGTGIFRKISDGNIIVNQILFHYFQIRSIDIGDLSHPYLIC